MKKINLIVLILLVVINKPMAQNVGIGTNNPSEKLDVNGGIKIGSTNNTAAGTIRWNATTNDFEGYNGTKWISFTASRTNWGMFPMIENYSPVLELNSGYNHGTGLGNALASSGNYIISGASGDYMPDGSIRSGSVRLLKNINGIWTPYHAIYSPNPSSDGKFGSSVAMSGNYIIAGTPDHAQGRAYIFQLTDSNAGPVVTTRALLTDINGTVGDKIGVSVGIHGDLAITGASSSGPSRTGKVYTYKRNDNLWLPLPVLTAFDAAPNDYFGNAVGISGQYIAVGAYYADVNGLSNKGKVYIYRLNQQSTGWDHITTLTSPGSVDSTYFGRSICMRGDTLLISAGLTFNSASPKVYLFTNNAGNWTLRDSLVSPTGPSTDEDFGQAIHFEGNKIIVSASASTVNNLAYKGRAFVFVSDGVKWNHAATLIGTGNEDYQYFGQAVLIKNNELIIGAPGADVLFPTNLHTRQSHGKIFCYTQ